MTRDVEYLLIGGGLACAIAAESLRVEGATGQIVLISAEDILPYYRPLIPKVFLQGKIEQKKSLIFSQEFYNKNQIETILGTKAVAVDPKSKLVKTDTAGDFHFKKLLIATGCYPKKIDLPGNDLVGIHYLHTFNDAAAILNAMHGATKAVIYGGNSIGIELASSFTQKGIQVTLIAEQFILFNAYPFEQPKSYLEQHGVAVILEGINKFNGNENIESIETTSGKNIPCDVVVVVANNEPITDFLHGSGITIDNGIVVDKFLHTNVPHVYAAGDVARFYDPVFGKYRRIEGTDNASKQGKLAALNMMNGRNCYRTASYCFFSAFGSSFVIVGDATDADEKIMRGSNTEKSFAALHLKDGLLKSAFFCGRPIGEIKASDSLIVNHINLNAYKDKIADINFPLESLATQTVLTLQGGGALGAFECGVVKAMEEHQIYPDIVAGISIGAFNSAIIASNPKNATKALEAFWDELAVDTIPTPDEQTRRILSTWQSIMFGNPKFFHPRWLLPMENLDKLPINWTNLYDPSSIKNLLCRYVDFDKLSDSPVRLLVMAVNVETAEFQTFDSYTEKITPDHILASGSLPPAFPWTTINGKHYWDGGIVTNTALDSTLEICGSSGKKVYVVELYPRMRSLPQNMLDVLTRKDEILLSEKIRKGIRDRELVGRYRKIVEIILRLSDPEKVEQIEQLPLYIQTMGDPGLLYTTRIIRETHKEEPYSWDSDFSRETIEEHKTRGYETANKTLKNEASRQ